MSVSLEQTVTERLRILSFFPWCFNLQGLLSLKAPKQEGGKSIYVVYARVKFQLLMYVKKKKNEGSK